MGRETVLLVEDEPLVRNLVRAVLEGNGYEVIEAAGAHAALELAHAHPGPIDLLLTDVLMPRMPGTELAPLLLARRPGTRVLYMSASLAEGAGADPLLVKPFTLEELERAVRNALARPQAA